MENTASKSFFVALIAFSIGILPATTASAQSSIATYEACIERIVYDARRAYEEADKWYRNGGGTPAEDCKAQALMQLGEVKAGAKTFSKLGQSESTGSRKLRAAYAAKSSRAWLILNAYDQAASEMQRAIDLAEGHIGLQTELLTERARGRIEKRAFEEAANDLSVILEKLPELSEARALRAHCYRRIGKDKEAALDLAIAIATDPEQLEALAERGSVRWALGDIEGAKSDWQNVLDRNQPGLARQIALRGLARMD